MGEEEHDLCREADLSKQLKCSSENLCCCTGKMQSLTSNYDDEAGISSDLLGERCVLQAFTLEIVLKILAFRIDFVKDVWNWFDTFLATWH